MKWLKIALLGLGCAVLYWTIRSVGTQGIMDTILGLGWKLAPLLAVYPFIFAFNTLGWIYSFPKNLPAQTPFWDLYRIRIIGETLNAIVPWAASLGGEPIKVELLKSRHGVRASEGYASILIVHTTLWISLNLFVIGGLAVTFQSKPLTPVLWNSVLAFLATLGLGAALLVIGMHFGVFQNIHSLGESLKWWGSASSEKKSHFLSLDEAIKKFYTENRKNFYLSALYNFIAWWIGSIEVYWVARILGIPMSFTEAWLFEALFQVLRIVTFFIPSSIGAQEGGIVLIFQQFGIGGAPALLFALIRRLREVFWIGVGLLLWFFLEDRKRLKASTVQDPD
jgi:uncharacterized protein (TIRG00374 family)